MSGDDPFAPIGGSGGNEGSSPKPEAVSVVPVPADAPTRPTAHRDLGTPSQTWTYRDQAGALLGYVHRFDKSGTKSFRPQVLFQPTKGGKPVWRWLSWDPPRPLYGLDRLAARSDAIVVVCEGEKAADAAGRLLPNCVVMTSPAGSNSADRADWTPLQGRHVVLWPDADAAGAVYADAVAKACHQAGAASVAVLKPPGKAAEGWDAADAEAEGWTTDQATTLLALAKPALTAIEGRRGRARTRKTNAESGDEAGETERGRRRPARDIVMEAVAGCRFWVATDDKCYVVFSKNGHTETWPIRSTTFNRWVRHRVHCLTGTTPGSQAIDDALLLCEAIASESPSPREAWRRVGRADGKIYIDLCDSAWRCVEIGPTHWRVLPAHELLFTRTDPMLSLPEPSGGMIEALRRFVNVHDERDFTLVVAWLLAAIRPTGPYPILVVNGEQGSGKSNLCRLLRSLVDPNKSPIRSAPGDERDLVIAAHNAHCLVFDNISKVEPWLSDALCRIATGGGFATRQLHSDAGEMVFNATRPIVLNGIPSLTDRPDLAERSIRITLAAIDEQHRQTESEWWADWESVRPEVLSALYDAASRGLARLAEGVRLPSKPRMADFAQWAVACEPGLGWDPGTFMQAYTENLQDVSDASFEADPVAVAIRAMMSLDEHQQGWSGTATELLVALEDHVSPSMKSSRSWPYNAQGLGNRIERVKPLLRGRDILIERKHSGTRTITIVWRQPEA